MSVFFSGTKARLVAALPVGAEFQTWRAIKLPGEPSDWRWGTWDRPTRHRAAFASGYFINNAKDEHFGVIPRYRHGRVYHVGVPHWRRSDSAGYVQIWDSYSHVCRLGPGKAVISRMDAPEYEAALAGCGYRRMPGMYLPAWAATAWALCLSADAQMLGAVTEEQAKAELVERLDPMSYEWKAYSGQWMAALSARQSFLTMVDAIHGKPVPRETWGWRYAFRMVEQPAEAGEGA